MYGKCGATEKAQQVFDDLAVRNAVSWNALMAGYAQNGHSQQALQCYEQMSQEGFTADAFTLVCVLKACGNSGALEKGRKVHDYIVHEKLPKDVFVVGALVEMYAHCGEFQKAQEVFDDLPFQTVITWTALITGYLQHGHFKEAFCCFKRMLSKSLLPDFVTLACILKACGHIGALNEGQEIHAFIVREQITGKDVLVSNALVDMYARFGALQKAQGLFNDLPSLDIVSWNILITGYAQHAYGNEALYCFEKMQEMGYFPDAVTFMCILKACGSISAIEKGQKVHVQVLKEGLLDKHASVANALLDMYIKCGALEKAKVFLCGLQKQDAVSWNSLLSGYAQKGQGREALECFSHMQAAGFSPDAVTYACILSACGSIRALDKGREIHSQLLKGQILRNHVVAAYALVDMYAKCGELENAQEVFEELPVRNLVVWTSLLAGFAENKQGDEAFSCFERLQLEGFSPDAYTFACTLKACSNVGAAEKGQIVHTAIAKQGLLEKDKVIGITLLDMYASCGMILEAHNVFDKLPARDVVTWSVLMVGYVQLGKVEVVLTLFDRMIREGMKPDTVTLTIVLNMCSRRGLLSRGQTYFENMSKGFGIMPSVKHQNCMVDLFGRAGHFEKAMTMISSSTPLNSITWLTLLSACRKSDNAKLGAWVFETASQIV
ncbi:hypothetical protein KP509_18G049200 [Ceratopteris richardii]|nr:hypothetical protein KP509_18G049200 [Ceratopteris richardii]